MRTSTRIAAAAAAAAALLAPASAVALTNAASSSSSLIDVAGLFQAAPRGDSTAVINQGDTVRIGTSECTVGYIDHDTHRAYVAKHCADTDAVAVSSHDGRIMGAVSHSDKGDDVAYIELDAHVAAGDNAITGDTVIDRATVALGDTVCFYTADSNGESRTECGPVTGIGSDSFPFVVATTNGPLTPAGANGPAWITGKGMLGTVSYTPAAMPGTPGVKTSMIAPYTE